jgi:hypothetical protein
MGFGEWLSGAGSAVDRFLGGTGGEPLPATTQPQISSDGYETIPSTPVTQDVVAPIPSPIPENVTNIQGADEQGTYKSVITDTSTPATQNFVESYVDSAKTGSIDRIGYTRPEDIGDSKTQALIRDGYSPLQATAMQREEEIAKLVAKGYSREDAAESRAAMYYTNEAKKAADSIDAMSASKHHDAMASGLPTSPNEFEHAGDLARQFGYKIEGVANIPGLKKDDPLLVPFKGSFLEDANIITKTQRTGEMGDYKYLGKPFSSTYGTLDLSTQQAIGKQAAASALASGKEGPQSGWKIDEHIMDKYTPELAKGAGFNLAYKEATFGDMGKVRGGTTGGTTIENIAALASDKEGKGKAYQIEMEDGSMVTRYESDLNPFSNLFPQTKSLPVFGMEENTAVKSPGITARTINDFLLPEDKVVVGGKSDYKVELPGANVAASSTGVLNTTQLSKGTQVVKPEVKSVVDKELYKTGLSTEMNVGGIHLGGRLGSGENVAGQTMESWGIQPIYRPPGMGPLRLPRKAKPSSPIIKRKLQSKKPYGMMTIDDHAILKNLGRDFFKFKVGSPNTVIKSNRARVSPVVNINTDNLRLKQDTKSIIALPKINISKGKSNTSANINGILNRATKKVKSK